MSMFKTKEENLRKTQTKVTTAANTIQKEILNVRNIRSGFSKKEQEVLEDAVKILLDFKNRVKHSKEKYVRAKKNAKQEESNVKAINSERVKRVVNALPVNVCIELSLMSYYGDGRLAEEVEVREYSINQLQSAKSDPVELKRLFDRAKEDVAYLLMEMLPHQKYSGGFDDQSGEFIDFLHAPTACSKEFIEELIKKHVIHRAVVMPRNIEYVNETVRLINLARSVNQTINKIKQSK